MQAYFWRAIAKYFFARRVTAILDSQGRRRLGRERNFYQGDGRYARGRRAEGEGEENVRSLIRRLHCRLLNKLTTYMPLLTRTLCMIFFISWKSGLSSGFSIQHCFISSRNSSTPVISVVTVGRNGGNSPSFVLRIMSTATKKYNLLTILKTPLEML